MEPPSAEEVQFQQKLEVADSAKEAYWQQYGQLVENLSLEHLEDFAEILKADNVTFNKEVLLKDFKQNLLKDILASMEKSWEMCSIRVNIATLEMMKERYAECEEPAWRPYGKSVEEQTLPIRMQRLEATKRYLKKQLDFQNYKLEELLKHNLMYRNEIEQVKVQRSFIRDQMHRGITELQNLKADYKDMIHKIMYKN